MPKLAIYSIWHLIFDPIREFAGTASLFVGGWAVRKFLIRKAMIAFRTQKEDTMALDLSKDFQVSHEFKINIQLNKQMVAKLSASYSGTDGAVGELSLSAPVKPYLAKLKAKIPGQIDDVIIDLAEKAAEVAVGANEVADAAAAQAAAVAPASV